MYDWNHNGKHDAFDDAMFHALLEDDLEKNPPTDRRLSKSPIDGTEGCSIGCAFVFGIVFYIFLTLIGL